MPQFAHLIIHLESSAKDLANIPIAMEELLLSLAKTSIHTAQQLQFILLAALEDYQPENSNGKKNPRSNAYRYFRCARMLKRLEQVVVYHRVVPTPYYLRQVALTGSEMGAMGTDLRKAGFLLFKRNERKSVLASKSWKRRFFTVQYGILSCYHFADDKEPLRSICLSGSTIDEHPADSKYNFAFNVFNATSSIFFQLRAADEDSFRHWTQFIRK